MNVPPPRIPFNKPFLAGKELEYIAEAVARGHLAGDGHFTQACSRFLEQRFRIPTVLMTPSGTAALEMAALLCNLAPGDEVIMPSFTFVSTANAVVRCGARPLFVDIRPDTLNIDERLIESAWTQHVKAVFVVHYAGVACAVPAIRELVERRGVLLVEDAAQGVNAACQQRPLGSWGHLAAFSFHETKNYIAGEGGALCINDPQLVERAEIIRDKGTDRKKFLQGQVDKYTWVDVGSSYVPSEIVCAYLFGQLEVMDIITRRRQSIFDAYREGLSDLEQAGHLRLPVIPNDCQGNAHMFHVLLATAAERDQLLVWLNEQNIHAVFHYVPLHTSRMGRQLGYRPGMLPVTEDVSARLLRLPFYYELTEADQQRVIAAIQAFFRR